MSSKCDDLVQHLLRVNAGLFKGTERRKSNVFLVICSISFPSALHKPNIFHLGATQIVEGGMKVVASIFFRTSIFLHLKLAIA